MNILVTGANGFIGSFVIEEGVRRGYNMWAAVRRGSNCGYIDEKRVHLLHIDYSSEKSILNTLYEHKNNSGAFDVIIHTAGVTKSSNSKGFDDGNYHITERLINALCHADMLPKQFIYMSTLGTYGAVHEKEPFETIKESDIQIPETNYGKSKLKTEILLKSIPGLNYVIFRPTGVYGPRDKDYFLMAKSIKYRFNFISGIKRQSITFIYVKDLVKAIYSAIDKEVQKRCYFVSDGNQYSSTEFGNLIAAEFGYKWIINLKCPLPLVWIICHTLGGVAALFCKTFTLNRDKYHIVAQRNWLCDITALQQELDFTPDYPLQRGVKETVEWYKSNGWL